MGTNLKKLIAWLPLLTLLPLMAFGGQWEMDFDALWASAGGVGNTYDKYLVGRFDFNDGYGSIASNQKDPLKSLNLSGGYTWSSDSKEGDYCIEFNGSTGYGQVADTNYLQATDTMTICFWYKADTLSGVRAMVSTRDSGGSYIIFNVNSYFSWDQNYLFAQNRWDKMFVQTVSTWYHVAAVKNSGESRDLYINGVWVASDPTGGTSSTGSPFTVGRDSGIAQYFWDGKIDDVRIYNSNLNASDIASIYAGDD